VSPQLIIAVGWGFIFCYSINIDFIALIIGCVYMIDNQENTPPPKIFEKKFDNLM